MHDKPAYDLTLPAAQTSCAVFSSPHSGRDYPLDLLARARLGAHQLRRSEDAFVEELFAAAPSYGAPLIAARAPRAYVDLNRAPEELDPVLISGVRANGLNPRLAAGLGVIPRVVAEGAPIYHGKLSRREATFRLQRHYRPYHARLETLLAETEARMGMALLIDCHSMPMDALRAAPRVNGKRPEIVLGDRFGAACAGWVSDQAQAALVGAGFVVCRNTPFAGGYITQKYGRPSQNLHALQIEIDRSLYMNEARIERTEAFDAMRRALEPVIAALAALGQNPVSLAAE